MKSLVTNTPLNLNTVQNVKNILRVSINPQVSDSEINGISELLMNFKDVFGKDGNSELGLFPFEVEINTVPGKAESVRQHPLPAAFKDSLNKEILRMRKMDIIEPCYSNFGWNSPIIPVKKKSGEIRLYCKFKKTVNVHLTENSEKFQLPCCETLFLEIEQSNKYFGSFDVRNGYWQLNIKESDRHKTAFQYGNKTFQFRRLPFG